MGKDKDRKKKDAVVLLAIVLVTFSIRLIFYNNGYLYGVDPYYHFYNVKNIVEQGGTIFPLNLYFPAIFLYGILKFFNVTLYDSFRLTSPIFGALTVIAAFFLAKEFLNRRLAFFSAILLALIPAFVTRTFAANYRGDLFSMFFYVLGFLFFIKAVKSREKKLNSFAIAAIAGMSFALSGFVWSVGYVFSMLIISVSLIIISIREFIDPGDTGEMRGARLSYVIAAGLGIAFIYTFNRFELAKSPTGFSDFYRYVFPLSFGFSFVLASASARLEDWTAKKRAWLVIGFLLIGAALTYTFLDGMADRMLSIYGKVESYKISRPTAELMGVDKDMLFERFSILTFLVPVGLFLMLKKFSKKTKKRRTEQVLLFVWFFSSSSIRWVRGAFFRPRFHLQ